MSMVPESMLGFGAPLWLNEPPVFLFVVFLSNFGFMGIGGFKAILPGRECK